MEQYADEGEGYVFFPERQAGCEGSMDKACEYQQGVGHVLEVMIRRVALPVAREIAAVQVDDILENSGEPCEIIVQIDQGNQVLDFLIDALGEIRLDEVSDEYPVADRIHGSSSFSIKQI
jgi:hypothetical protein